MTTDDIPDAGAPDVTGAPPAGDGPTRRPSPAATAASRARRIGGRVNPGQPGAPVPGETSANGSGGLAAEAVTLRKSKMATLDDDSFETGSSERVVAVVPAWLRWLPAAVLTAGVLAMAALMVVFSHGVWWGRPAASTVREQLLAAAKTCVVKTNTYKYTALDKYDAAVRECTTGRLTPQIQKTISTVIKKYAPTLKATQTAQISRGAIESVSPHGKQWTVLVFGQLSVVNTNEPKGRTDPFAAQVQMEKVNGSWLMSGLKTVATPVS